MTTVNDVCKYTMNGQEVVKQVGLLLHASSSTWQSEKGKYIYRKENTIPYKLLRIKNI